MNSYVTGSPCERMNDSTHQHMPSAAFALNQNTNPFPSLRAHRPRPRLGVPCLADLASAPASSSILCSFCRSHLCRSFSRAGWSSLLPSVPPAPCHSTDHYSACTASVSCPCWTLSTSRAGPQLFTGVPSFRAHCLAAGQACCH